MGVYNPYDLSRYIMENTPVVKDSAVYVIVNDLGEVVDIGKKKGQFSSMSGAKQALNRFIGSKIRWYEYHILIPSIQKLRDEEFNAEVRETVEFLIDNKLIIIEKMVT